MLDTRPGIFLMKKVFAKRAAPKKKKTAPTGTLDGRNWKPYATDIAGEG
jgi:hypothetical protein